MFTGIVTHIGKVDNLVKKSNQDLLVTIQLQNKNIGRELEDGCSISCCGICLTLINKNQKEDSLYLKFQASEETVKKTNISHWKKNDKINIEFALRMGDELGGHMVSGHIDGTSKIQSIIKNDQSHIFTFNTPKNLKQFISKKGSITINGISLTINEVDENSFNVNIIDHSFNNTNLCNLVVSDVVNLEVDLIARYLQDLIKHKK